MVTLPINARNFKFGHCKHWLMATLCIHHGLGAFRNFRSIIRIDYGVPDVVGSQNFVPRSGQTFTATGQTFTAINSTSISISADVETFCAILI
jgi:hypothetical protein